MEMEQKLLEYYRANLKKGKFPSNKEIRSKAKKISNSKDFKASKGWLVKFKKRYSLNNK